LVTVKGLVSAFLEEEHMALKEYKPGTAFHGVIGLTTDQSN
jgi:hypothetical protein